MKNKCQLFLEIDNHSTANRAASHSNSILYLLEPIWLIFKHKIHFFIF